MAESESAFVATHLNTGDATLYLVERDGPETPVVCVHGSWDDHRTWQGCVEHLPAGHHVVVYDRRGHSQSTAPDRQGTIADDVADLAAVIDHMGRSAVVVGHSYGAAVALLAALNHPELVLGVVAHEPPMFAVLKDRPEYQTLLATVSSAMAEAARLIESGEPARAAELFVNEVAFGRDAWSTIFGPEDRATMVANAPTWLDQYRDPDRLALSPSLLATATQPLVVTRGTASLTIFDASLDLALSAVPTVQSHRIDGAGHAAPLTHPDALGEVVVALLAQLT